MSIKIVESEKEVTVPAEKEPVARIVIEFMDDKTYRWMAQGPVPDLIVTNACEVIKATFVSHQLQKVMQQQVQAMQKRVTLPDGSFLPPRT